jgi:hypothetical protein
MQKLMRFLQILISPPVFLTIIFLWLLLPGLNIPALNNVVFFIGVPVLILACITDEVNFWTGKISKWKKPDSSRHRKKSDSVGTNS